MGYMPPSDERSTWPRSTPIMGASIPSMINLYEKGRLTKDEARWLSQCGLDTPDPPSMWNGLVVFVAIACLCCFSFSIGCWVAQMQGLQIAEAMQTLENPER